MSSKLKCSILRVLKICECLICCPVVSYILFNLQNGILINYESLDEKIMTYNYKKPSTMFIIPPLNLLCCAIMHVIIILKKSYIHV